MTRVTERETDAVFKKGVRNTQSIVVVVCVCMSQRVGEATVIGKCSFECSNILFFPPTEAKWEFEGIHSLSNCMCVPCARGETKRDGP